jgi:hypothetical protein
LNSAALAHTTLIKTANWPEQQWADASNVVVFIVTPSGADSSPEWIRGVEQQRRFRSNKCRACDRWNQASILDAHASLEHGVKNALLAPNIARREFAVRHQAG